MGQPPFPLLRRFALGIVLVSLGCSRAHYRLDADHDVYGIIAEKTTDAGHVAPVTSVEAPPQSRLYDPYDPDRPPMPPDDPIAHQYMHSPNGMKGSRHWHDDGDSPSVEDLTWRTFLPTDNEGTLLMTRQRAVDLSVLHSRDYQFQRDRVYNFSLNLSLNRFNFQTQWFATNFTQFHHFGSGKADNESNTLSTTSNFGFSRLFGTGGQLMVDALNTFTWEFAGPDAGTVSTVLGINFVQPLLRRAWRDVRLESLTQDERNVLYAVRDYARFRRTFYFSIVNGRDGFLSLLLQIQNIRNLESNLKSLNETLLEHEALFRAGVVSRIQVDQVFQRYQQGRLELILAQNQYQDSLDAYKLRLGLPPDLPVKLDESLLSPFQLTAPELDNLQKESDEFVARWRVLDEPPEQTVLSRGFDQLAALLEKLTAARAAVMSEFQQWRRGPKEAKTPGTPSASEAEFVGQLTDRLDDVSTAQNNVAAALKAARAKLAPATREESWQTLQRLARQYTAAVADLALAQTQVRVQLIRLEPLDITGEVAVRFALQNRLDLMNEKARVVDAWRQIRVAADALQSDLDVVFHADVGTRGIGNDGSISDGGDNPVDFSSSASRYRLGVRFDSPLNRRAERNLYRRELIQYQQQRRLYMGEEDRVIQSVRRDVRQLEADRVSFEIALQSMVVAARQVEEARAQLFEPGRPNDSSNTADVLNALQILLRVRNDLVGSWVNYETSRIQLLVDIEALEIDDSGHAIDARGEWPWNAMIPECDLSGDAPKLFAPPKNGPPRESPSSIEQPSPTDGRHEEIPAPARP